MTYDHKFYCGKHRHFEPCQECAKADVWDGEALIFKRDAEKRIKELEQELEISQKFHNVAVAERDYERHLVGKLRSALENLLDAVEQAMDNIDMENRTVHSFAALQVLVNALIYHGRREKENDISKGTP